MRLEAVGNLWQKLGRWERLALVVWCGLLLGIGVRSLFWPRVHSVYPIFIDAARNWQAGEELYWPYRPPNGLDLYRYSPLVAALLVPFTVFPDSLGGTLWRLLNAGVYLGGLAWWSRAVLPWPLTGRQIALLFLLVLPLSVSSINNAQSNALVMGLLLAGVAGAMTERWNLSALCVTLACLFKIYPIAIGMLLLVIYPRKFALRFLAMLLAGLALPFLLHQPDYVANQYAHWVTLLRIDDRSDNAFSVSYRDMWLLCRLWRLPLNHHGYMVVQIMVAAGVAGLCLGAQRQGWPRRRLLTLLLCQGCLWMTLWGPTTESCTYILLAPTLAWGVLEAWVERRPWWNKALVTSSLTLFALAPLPAWFPGGHQWTPAGLLPFAALLLFASMLECTVRDLLGQAAIRNGPAEVVTARAA